MKLKKFVRGWESEILDERMSRIYQLKTPQERLQIYFSMWDAAWHFLEAKLEAEHPQWSTERLNKAVAERMSHGTC